MESLPLFSPYAVDALMLALIIAQLKLEHFPLLEFVQLPHALDLLLKHRSDHLIPWCL